MFTHGYRCTKEDKVPNARPPSATGGVETTDPIPQRERRGRAFLATSANVVFASTKVLLYGRMSLTKIKTSTKQRTHWYRCEPPLGKKGGHYFFQRRVYRRILKVSMSCYSSKKRVICSCICQSIPTHSNVIRGQLRWKRRPLRKLQASLSDQRYHLGPVVTFSSLMSICHVLLDSPSRPNHPTCTMIEGDIDESCMLGGGFSGPKNCWSRYRDLRL